MKVHHLHSYSPNFPVKWIPTASYELFEIQGSEGRDPYFPPWKKGNHEQRRVGEREACRIANPFLAVTYQRNEELLMSRKFASGEIASERSETS